MTLTEQEIKEVQESWEIAKTLGIDTIGRIFYQRIFAQAPSALEMFSFKDDENMYESDSFKKHARNVVLTVGRAVAGLRDLAATAPILVSLGARHHKYGVTAEHYPIIGEALLFTLETGLGDKFTPAVRKAWEGTYAIVAGAMQAGAKQAAEAEE